MLKPEFDVVLNDRRAACHSADNLPVFEAVHHVERLHPALRYSSPIIAELPDAAVLGRQHRLGRLFLGRRRKVKLADCGKTSDPQRFLQYGRAGGNDPLNESYTDSTILKPLGRR
jgi:hypothetical protein